ISGKRKPAAMTRSDRGRADMGRSMRLTANSLAMSVCLGAAALAAPVAALAHHAFATEFDVNSPVELRGEVTKVELMNPHSWITIAVEGEDGEVTEWMFEGGSPNALVRRGITKQSVPLGAELVVTGYQA